MAQWQRVIQSDDDKIGSVETINFVSFRDGDEINETQDELEIPDVEEQANIILQQAQIEIENMIQNAQSEADKIRNDAFHAGYQEGQGKAMNELKEKVDNLTQLFTNAINEVAVIRDEIIGNAEDDIIELTIAVVEKLVCHEIGQNPDFIIEVVKEAIKVAKSGNEMVLRINPDDRGSLEKNAKELIELARSATFDANLKLIIEDDENLNPGDCVVVTDKNIFDMTFKSKLDSVIETIDSHKSQAEIGNNV